MCMPVTRLWCGLLSWAWKGDRGGDPTLSSDPSSPPMAPLMGLSHPLTCLHCGSPAHGSPSQLSLMMCLSWKKLTYFYKPLTVTLGPSGQRGRPAVYVPIGWRGGREGVRLLPGPEAGPGSCSISRLSAVISFLLHRIPTLPALTHPM